MYEFIDTEKWERREIYDMFLGYTYTITADIDVTLLREQTKAKGYKFYPSICYCIGKAVNSDSDYRFARIDGKPVCFDKVELHYNLLRNDGSRCFTHARIPCLDNFAEHYALFEKAKDSAESCGKLFDYDTPTLDCVHISVFPKISPTSISIVKPARYSGYDKPSTSFIPFVVVGGFREVNGRLMCPITAEFHHCVNDGFHAQKFFLLLEQVCREFTL